MTPALTPIENNGIIPFLGVMTLWYVIKVVFMCGKGLVPCDRLLPGLTGVEVAPGHIGGATVLGACVYLWLYEVAEQTVQQCN